MPRVALLICLAAAGRAGAAGEYDWVVTEAERSLGSAQRQVRVYPEDQDARWRLAWAFVELAHARAQADGAFLPDTGELEQNAIVRDQYREFVLPGLEAGTAALHLARTDADRADAYQRLAGLYSQGGEPEAALAALRFAERTGHDRCRVYEFEGRLYGQMGMRPEAVTAHLRAKWYAAAAPSFPRPGVLFAFLVWMMLPAALLRVGLATIGRATVGESDLALASLMARARRHRWSRVLVGLTGGVGVAAAWFAGVAMWFVIERLAVGIGGQGSDHLARDYVWLHYRTAWIGLSLAMAVAADWVGPWAALPAAPPVLVLTYAWWTAAGRYPDSSTHFLPTGDGIAAILCVLAIPLGLWLGLAYRRRRAADASAPPSTAAAPATSAAPPAP